jgi:hypothetical protein
MLAMGSLSAVFCSDDAFVRADKSASDAYSTGDYKRAQERWNKLLERLNLEVSRSDATKTLNEQIETTLRHLGECALAQKNYDKADDYLGQAKTAAVILQQNDADLDKDFRDLAANYRQIDLANLGNLGIVGPLVTIGLRDFRPTKISVAKTDNGHHVSVLLADDAIKEIGSKGITQVGVSKNMSFDLIQGDGGVVTLANIIGVKVHAGFWVNIINSSLKLDESQHPVALVTAQKMGISQSVSTPLPYIIYLPVLGIVSQVKALFGEEGSQLPTVIATPINGPAGEPAGDGPKGSSTTPQTEGSGLAPVTNSFSVMGAVVPLPAAQPQADIGARTRSPGLDLNSAQDLPALPAPPLEQIAPTSTPTPEHVN